MGAYRAPAQNESDYSCEDEILLRKEKMTWTLSL